MMKNFNKVDSLKCNNEYKSYYDVTATISENLVTYPDDPVYERKTVVSLGAGSSYHLDKFCMGGHTGTHIDYPAHVIEGGKNSNDYAIDELIGQGVIVEVPFEEKLITKNFIKKQEILKNDFVFFKTSNSNISKNEKFTENYVYIEPAAAEELLKKGVRVVGIDYISVDSSDAEDLPVHKIFLSKEVLIVEGLELKEVPAGRCKIYIMPIKIENMDGLPARVTVQK